MIPSDPGCFHLEFYCQEAVSSDKCYLISTEAARSGRFIDLK